MLCIHLWMTDQAAERRKDDSSYFLILSSAMAILLKRNIFKNLDYYWNPVTLVLIWKLSLSTFKWIPMWQGSNDYSAFYKFLFWAQNHHGRWEGSPNITIMRNFKIRSKRIRRNICTCIVQPFSNQTATMKMSRLASRLLTGNLLMKCWSSFSGAQDIL